MDFQEVFSQCVQGYHFMNDTPINETMWEDINAEVLTAAGCEVFHQANGGHKSGADLFTSIGNLSNKSSQYDTPTSFKMSSYRLTTVCSDKDPGSVETIVPEIEKRKNFTFYSILLRKDHPTEILYDWFLIPSDHPSVDPTAYTWTPKIGKQGKKKDTVIGWETNTVNGSNMCIIFSMSSQLWVHIEITEEMKQFKKASYTASKGKKVNYLQLFKMLA